MLRVVSGLWLSFALAPTPTADPTEAPTAPLAVREVPSAGSVASFPVERAWTITLPVRRKTPLSVHYLPASLGVELDVPVELGVVEAELASVEEGLHATARATEIGTRITISSPQHRVRATLGRSANAMTLRVGAESEDQRLRDLATIVALPLPEPKGLGAYLELWHEAETALGSGELRRALELWQRLERTKTIADLAALRIAELFILSGHVNEARARLSAVSRRHPRSNGASLARLDLLHLDALTGDDAATTSHIVFSTESLGGRSFSTYGWFRAAAILRELDRPADALDHFPDVNGLPSSWRERANTLRQALVSEAVCSPWFHGDPVGTAVAYRRWEADLELHPRRADILRHTVDALTSLGLYADVRPIARELLRAGPGRVDEADLVLNLAAAYVRGADEARATEVVRFAALSHARAPKLLSRVRGLALMLNEAHGLPKAQALLADLGAKTPSLLPSLLSLSSDFAVAYGSPLNQAQTLALSRKAGFDDESKREPQLAIALALAGRARDASPLLRKWIGKTTDPELRDRMAYHLAEAEQTLGHDKDAAQILGTIATRGTTYGQIANLRLQERKLQATLVQLAPLAPESKTP